VPDYSRGFVVIGLFTGDRVPETLGGIVESKKRAEEVGASEAATLLHAQDLVYGHSSRLDLTLREQAAYSAGAIACCSRLLKAGQVNEPLGEFRVKPWYSSGFALKAELVSADSASSEANAKTYFIASRHYIDVVFHGCISLKQGD
jgi:hypothetical protein